MKKLVLALSAVAAFSAPALAADMAMKARPAPPPVPVANWTGCYVGAGFGYGLYDIETQQVFRNPATGVVTVLGAPFDQGGRGWLGGGGGGCDYQFPLGTQQFVVGVLADYYWANIKGGFTGNGAGVGLDGGQEKVNSMWAVGGRIGWLATPQLLTYFSGGYTEAHRTGVSNYFDFRGTTPVPTNIGLSGGTAKGWFLGSGVEYTFGWLPNLTWKTEYRYSEFNTRESAEFSTLTGLPTGTFSRDKLIINTVLSSLVYRFNWGGPVVAKY